MNLSERVEEFNKEFSFAAANAAFKRCGDPTMQHASPKPPNSLDNRKVREGPGEVAKHTEL